MTTDDFQYWLDGAPVDVRNDDFQYWLDGAPVSDGVAAIPGLETVQNVVIC